MTPQLCWSGKSTPFSNSVCGDSVEHPPITRIKKIKHIEKDYLKVLKLFINTKYVWGGKTYQGIDCSAILQLFYYYNNKFYPRDTKDQIKYSKKKIKQKLFKKE